MTTKIIPDNAIAKIVLDAGWTGYTVVGMVQTILAENNGDAYAIYINEDDTIDVGLFSLNTRWVPTPSMYERLTPNLAAKYARGIWVDWFEWSSGTYGERVANAFKKGWMAYSSTRFPIYRPRALVAAKAVGAI